MFFSAYPIQPSQLPPPKSSPSNPPKPQKKLNLTPQADHVPLTHSRVLPSVSHPSGPPPLDAARPLGGGEAGTVPVPRWIRHRECLDKKEETSGTTTTQTTCEAEKQKKNTNNLYCNLYFIVFFCCLSGGASLFLPSTVVGPGRDFLYKLAIFGSLSLLHSKHLHHLYELIVIFCANLQHVYPQQGFKRLDRGERP